MRLFIAINFNDKTLEHILALRDELRTLSKRGNFSAAENLHLTLAFLGECDVKQTADAKAAMDMVKFESFYLSIENVGCFRRDGGDTWWAGVQKSKPLLTLQNDLSGKLNDAGFSLDRRRYNPHITLGREVVTDAAARRISRFGETVTSIELMKSERIRGVLTYTAIHMRKSVN